MNENDQNFKSETLSSLITIFVEIYRFKKVLNRFVNKLEYVDRNKFSSQFMYFNKRIDEAMENSEIAIVDLEDQKYDYGMAASAINIDEFDENDVLYVQQMIEPIIRYKTSIVKNGTMILRRFEE